MCETLNDPSFLPYFICVICILCTRHQNIFNNIHVNIDLDLRSCLYICSDIKISHFLCSVSIYSYIKCKLSYFFFQLYFSLCDNEIFCTIKIKIRSSIILTYYLLSSTLCRSCETSTKHKLDCCIDPSCVEVQHQTTMVHCLLLIANISELDALMRPR